MSQTPSAYFTALRTAPVNSPSFKAELDLLNYAAASEGGSISASSQFSPDWPASGMIDGDRTHINAGAPGSADNGLGRSTWQGNIVSDGSGNLGTPEVITITLAQVKLVNRLKIIWWPTETKSGAGNFSGRDFLIETSPLTSGGVFSSWDGLVDRNADAGKGATSIASGQVTENTEDYNLFQDETSLFNPGFSDGGYGIGGGQATPVYGINVGQIRITITRLQSPSVRGRICEIELTRAVDITADIKNISTTRKKDYRLNHRLTAEASLTMLNFDRKYSQNHVPNSLEIQKAGFFNTELLPELECRIWIGYGSAVASGSGFGEGSFGGGPYGGASSSVGLIQVFTGYLYDIRPNAKVRTVGFKLRDFLKYLVNQNVTTNLKSNKSIEALCEYLVNLKNFPSNLCLLDSTTIAPAVFSPSESEFLTELQKLGDATGDSDIFIDEHGRFVFKSYLNVISHQLIIADQASFQAGTLDNIDATTQPGSIILTKSGGNYVPEGNWTSALSAVLTGIVEFTGFSEVSVNGLSSNVDFFIRLTNDGGATFTPWEPLYPAVETNFIELVIPGSNTQIQLRARLRTSDGTQTPAVSNLTVKYVSRGGSQKFQDAAVFSFESGKDLWDCESDFTSEVGGDSYIITDSIVKSTPTYASQGSQTAWQAVNNGSPVSASNPLLVGVGTLTFNIDYGKTQYAVPQTIVLTLGTAMATATITSHPSKPVLTLTVTQGGTINDLHVTGQPFIQLGNIQVETFAPTQNIKRYGRLQDVIDNNYIDNPDLASDISKSVIARFGSPLEWLPTIKVVLTPDLQINDRCTVKEPNLDINEDFYTLGVDHHVEVSGGKAQLSTSPSMIKIIPGQNGIDPAHFSGGLLYDNFKFGGVQTLAR